MLHHSMTGARDGTGPLHRTFTARFDRTGKRLITCGRETVFWDPETGTELARVPDATGGQAEFLPSGEWMAASDDVVRRWSAKPPYNRSARSCTPCGRRIRTGPAPLVPSLATARGWPSPNSVPGA